MIIEKDKAIEAIVNEPLLIGGYWFSEKREFGYGYVKLEDAAKLKTCSVCAVGSILRAHCFTKDPHQFKIIDACDFDYADTDFNEKFDENNDNYLGNLSMLFEHLSEDEDIKPNSMQMRMELINLIEMTWPQKFQIDTFGKRSVLKL